MSESRTYIEERRETLRARGNNTINGIDRIVVDSVDKSLLQVHLVHVPNAAPLFTKEDFEIHGGDRIRGLAVESVTQSGPVLTLQLNTEGDFSVHILRITRSDFDYVLRDIAFGFRAECPEVFDVCDLPPLEDVPPLPAPPTDYLAKDYESFRAQMLDRLSTLSPDWADREIPDIGITLVELLAHYGDHLSYAQDVAATEAYLNTARFRSSLRRHSRLLGYDVFDGLSARIFVQLVQDSGDAAASLAPSGMTFMTRNSRLKSEVVERVNIDVLRLIQDGSQFYEPVPITHLDTNGQIAIRPIELSPNHSFMQLHDWGDPLAILPRGTTQAWIVGNAADITLEAGDFICLEQVQQEGATAIEALQNVNELDFADISQRQIVRISEPPIAMRDDLPRTGPPVDLMKITWHADDALSFDLQIGNVPDPDHPLDLTKRVSLARACGNIILCDHGVSLTAPGSAPNAGEPLGAPLDMNDPEQKTSISSLSELDISAAFRPALRETQLSITHIHHDGEELASANSLRRIEADKAMPAVLVKQDDGRVWSPAKSLIDASDDAFLFVPELEENSRTYLRFAETGSFGGELSPGTPLYAHYRIGRGPSGNIGAEALHHIIRSVSLPFSQIRNPLSAFGGARPESFENIRINAPRVISKNERAVTPDDYAQKISLHKDVSAARVRKVWHGSWHTLFISVDLTGGKLLTEELGDELVEFLEPYRLMGQDIQIEPANFAPLDIILHICVDPAYRQADVLRAVRSAFSAARPRGGEPGFFHPDRLSFGDPVYLSQIYETAEAIAGVADVKVIRFARWGSGDESALEEGVLNVGPAEIISLMNDPNYPERGVLRVQAWKEA